MKLKLFFNLVFTFVGTAILLACTSVVAVNFFRDARVFASPAPVKASTDSSQETAPEEEDIDISQTLEYKRTVDPVPTRSPEETPENSPTPQPTPTTIEDTISVKVEVINYSGTKKLAESVREALELYGYKVSAGNGKSNTPIVTQIIERNDKGAGTDLKSILKIGNVIKIPDPKSRFDATIIIGDDYNP